jgi:hypothetical protein
MGVDEEIKVSGTLGQINKRDVLKVIKDAKDNRNQQIDEFYFLSVKKNNIKNLPVPQQKQITGYIGNKSVNIILWKN